MTMASERSIEPLASGSPRTKKLCGVSPSSLTSQKLASAVKSCSSVSPALATTPAWTVAEVSMSLVEPNRVQF